MKPIFLTDDNLIQAYWPDVDRLILPVVEHAARGEFNMADIKQMCEEKRAVAVVVVNESEAVLAMVFEFVYYPRITACNIIALGGKDLSAVANEFFITFKQFCYGMGVTVIEASCSSVISRLLKPLGFEKTYEVVRHEIRLL